jgi:hypothetical protein
LNYSVTYDTKYVSKLSPKIEIKSSLHFAVETICNKFVSDENRLKIGLKFISSYSQVCFEIIIKLLPEVLVVFDNERHSRLFGRFASAKCEKDFKRF